MSVDKCWAKIDKSGGSFDSKLNIYFDENETGASRSVKIRVRSKDGEVSSECTLVHKKKEQVVYRNTRQSKSFTKQGCNPVTEKGETLEYVVEAGKYTSFISQEDANNKAIQDIEQNGQNWVNNNGSCITILWYNRKQSKSFTKNDCDPDTEEGSTETMTIEAGVFSSTISQDDADNKALAELNAKGQDYANSHGTCTTVKWYNDAQTGRFQKTDCLATEVGSMVDYTVEAGRFYSFVSKDDANNQAKDALKQEGPEYANEHGTCETNLWYNEEKSETFTKDDCEDGFIGEEYTYTVEVGKYTSNISQEDANQKALDDIAENGQEQANLNADCIPDPNYFIGKATARVQKNDCDEISQEGSWVDLTEKDLVGYPDAFISRESQEDANALAEAAMEDQKQGLANQKGTCIDKDQFVGVYSKEFTKDNCDGEGIGSKVVVDQDDVDGGPFLSYESQDAANALAKAAVEAQGQAIANRDGYCTWTGKYSEEFTKDDCEEGQTGSKITVTEQDVVGGPFTSTESQDAANALAEAAVKEQGQAIANNKGNCDDMTVYTGHYSKSFTPECEACHEGVAMEVTAEMVNGSPVTSTESQDAADDEAKRIVEEGGQAYANKNGTCNPMSADPVWEDVVPEELRCNEGKSEKKQKNTNECSDTYNEERWVEGGDKVCSWTGVYSETFQRNDCEIPDSGTEVEVTQDDVVGGPFVSFVSQDDANNLAKEAVQSQGQEIANQRGSCRFVGVYSEEFTKDNCGSCQHGIPMTVTQDNVGGPFYSDESQEAANALAEAAVKSQGQAYANKNGTCEMDNTDPVWVDSDPLETECRDGVSYKKQINTNECYGGENEQWIEGGDKICTWTGVHSAEFTKECDGTGVGSKMTITQDDVEGHPFVSTVSQEDANAKAQAAVEAQGQAIVNAQGTCTWTGIASGTFTRGNCGSCKKGTSVLVTQDQVGGPFTSNISQEDANNKALEAVNAQGPAIANKNGDCLDDTKPASWSNTGNTRCNGCSSEAEQRDTEQCSSSYNTTRWVSGGGRNCTENGSWGSWSSWSCNGCTDTRYRDNSCGGREYEYDYNYSGCGSWQDQSWDGDCDGTYYIIYERNSCSGDVRESHRGQQEGRCGYVECDMTLNSGSTRPDVSYSGGSDSVSGTSVGGSSVTVSSSQSWCSPSVSQKLGDSNFLVIAECDANPTYSRRSAIVTVKNGCKTMNFTVNQEAKADDYVFTFADGSTGTKVWSGSADAQSIQYTVSSTKNGSYIGYSVESKPSWCTVNINSPSGTSALAVIPMTANTGTSSRSGTITLKQSDSGKTLTISVEQAAVAQSVCLTGGVSLVLKTDKTGYRGYTYRISTRNSVPLGSETRVEVMGKASLGGAADYVIYSFILSKGQTSWSDEIYTTVNDRGYPEFYCRLTPEDDCGNGIAISEVDDF